MGGESGAVVGGVVWPAGGPYRPLGFKCTRGQPDQTPNVRSSSKADQNGAAGGGLGAYFGDPCQPLSLQEVAANWIRFRSEKSPPTGFNGSRRR